MDDTLGRIYRVDAPVASPGNCGTCGNSSNEQGFVTFDNLDFEFYGTLYFCADCAKQIGRAVGMLSTEQSDELTRTVAEQGAELEVLRRSQLLTEQMVDDLQRLTEHLNINSAAIAADLSVANETPNEELQQQALGDDATVAEGTDITGDRGSESSATTQHVVEQGRDDLLDTSNEFQLSDIGL